MRFNLSNYKFPTPIKIRKMADSVMAACASVSVYSALWNYKVLTVIFIVIGFSAKFISDYFKDDNEPKS